MRKRDRLRQLEHALVRFCRDNKIVIRAGYSLAEPIKVTQGTDTVKIYEVTGKGISHYLQEDLQRRNI